MGMGAALIFGPCHSVSGGTAVPEAVLAGRRRDRCSAGGVTTGTAVDNTMGIGVVGNGDTSGIPVTGGGGAAG
ncbi:hypothetical protein AGMMS50230_12360 [Spirochaetia bacterium]|nr:hypothetical protein AGMMS50230_12360 [Spirochaetia bacterium]